MFKACLTVLLGLLLLGFASVAHSIESQTEALVLSEGSSFWPVTETHLSLSFAAAKDVDIALIERGELPFTLNPSDRSVPLYDGKETTLWGHVRLKNPRPSPVSVVSAIRYSPLDRVDWFWRDSSGKVSRHTAGQRVSRNANMAPSRFPMSELVVQPGETGDLLFRVRSDTLVILPVRVYERGRWQFDETRDLMFLGLLGGCLFTMVLLGSLFYFTFRRTEFLWFASYCLTSMVYLAMTSGFGKAIVWPQSAFALLPSLWIVMGLGLGVTALFVASFLRTAANAPRYHTLLVVIAAVSFLVCFNASLPDWATRLVFIVSTGLGPIAILSGAFVLWLHRVNGAGLIVISWIPNQSGLIWAYLRSMDVVPYFDGNHYTMPVTTTLTALAFMWALHRQSSQAEHEATHDQLTNLPNRTLFDRRISATNQQRRGSVGVMQVDLDGFKGINDNFGHAAGDFVLQTVADRLRNVLGTSGNTFRTGGDEFIVLCHRRTRKEDVKALANAIVETVSEPMEFRGDTLRVGASVGIAYPLADKDNILSAIDEADAALYEAKARGKGQVAAAASFGEMAHNRRSSDKTAS